MDTRFEANRKTEDLRLSLIWWLAGLGLATAAGILDSLWFSTAALAFALALIFVDRKAFRFYSIMILSVVALRVAFFAILLLFRLSDLSGLLPALGVGLKTAAMIAALGMSSTRANPKRFLRYAPTLILELTTAVGIAINLFPSMVTALQRARKARALRGRSRGISALRSIVIPVLEDAMDDAMQMAASMDARGFGERGIKKTRWR